MTKALPGFGLRSNIGNAVIMSTLRDQVMDCLVKSSAGMTKSFFKYRCMSLDNCIKVVAKDTPLSVATVCISMYRSWADSETINPFLRFFEECNNNI